MCEVNRFYQKRRMVIGVDKKEESTELAGGQGETCLH